ncbi:hypothetical protein HK101_002689, partial [Irineochytrium annulatum]
MALQPLDASVDTFAYSPVVAANTSFPLDLYVYVDPPGVLGTNEESSIIASIALQAVIPMTGGSTTISEPVCDRQPSGPPVACVRVPASKCFHVSCSVPAVNGLPPASYDVQAKWTYTCSNLLSIGCTGPKSISNQTAPIVLGGGFQATTTTTTTTVMISSTRGNPQLGTAPPVASTNAPTLGSGTTNPDPNATAAAQNANQGSSGSGGGISGGVIAAIVVVLLIAAAVGAFFVYRNVSAKKRRTDSMYMEGFGGVAAGGAGGASSGPAPMAGRSQAKDLFPTTPSAPASVASAPMTMSASASSSLPPAPPVKETASAVPDPVGAYYYGGAGGTAGTEVG